MKIDIGLTDLLLISPIISLFLMSLLPITIKVLRGNKEQPAIVTLIQAFIGLIISAGLLLVFGGAGKTAFNQTLIFDGVTQWVGLVAIAATAGSIVLMYENMATKGRQFSELIFLTLSSTLGMLVLVSAVDLLTMFVGLEVMSLSLYMMIGMSNEEKLSKEAAFKYFVLGSTASAIFLYGLALVFGSSGTTNIITLVEMAPRLMETNKLFLFGVIMLFAGFFFKVSIAPFHAWTPDVYQGSPTPHTAFMATAVKVVTFAALLRFVATKVLLVSPDLLDILQWLAVITMLVGNFGAILQNNIKRMIAYSSVSHSGYLLVGIITAGISDNSAFGATAVIFYLFSYAAMTIGLMAVVNIIEKSETHLVHIDDFSGLGKLNPIPAVCMTIFLLSLAGIPPLLGFFGKFYLFNAAIGEGLLWLAIWGVLNSVIAVYYYLRPIVYMYMHEPKGELATLPHNATTVAMIFTAIIIIFIGIVSGPIFTLVEQGLL